MNTTTTRFEDRNSVKTKHFNRGWCVKICPEGKGFSVRLSQFNGEVKSWFRFNRKDADLVFNQVVSFIGHK